MSDTEQDVTRVRALLGPTDPVPDAATLDRDAVAVRRQLAATPARGRTPRRRSARRVRAAPLVAAAMAAVLAVTGSVPLLRPAAAWAVERDPTLGVAIRVELPEFFQRGADPGEVVAALRRHDVAVDVRHGRDLTPWKAGAVIGVGQQIGSDEVPRVCLDRFMTDEGGPVEVCGIERLPTGGFVVYPEVFGGEVHLVVGVPVWQALPDDR